MKKLLTLFLFLAIGWTSTTSINAKGGGCFLPDTKILTPNGMVVVQDVHDGDTVSSYNQDTNSLESSTVLFVDKLTVDEYLVINGATRVTPDHPFYSSGLGLVYAKNINVGDVLVGVNRFPVIVDTISRVYQQTTVYNLISVTPNNNYFADGVLVHNKGASSAGRSSAGRSSTASHSSTSSKSTSTKSTTGSTSTKTTKPSTSTKTTTSQAPKSVNGIRQIKEKLDIK